MTTRDRPMRSRMCDHCKGYGTVVTLVGHDELIERECRNCGGTGRVSTPIKLPAALRRKKGQDQ